MSDALVTAEAEFLAQLIPVLESGAAGHNSWLFLRDQTAQDHGLGDQHSSLAEALASQAERILQLHGNLGQADPNCPAALFLRCCEEAADLEDRSHKGPQQTAEALLATLRNRGLGD